MLIQKIYLKIYCLSIEIHITFGCILSDVLPLPGHNFQAAHCKYIQWNYSGNGTHVKSVHFKSICHTQSNVEVTVTFIPLYLEQQLHLNSTVQITVKVGHMWKVHWTYLQCRYRKDRFKEIQQTSIKHHKWIKIEFSECQYAASTLVQQSLDVKM